MTRAGSPVAGSVNDAEPPAGTLDAFPTETPDGCTGAVVVDASGEPPTVDVVDAGPPVVVVGGILLVSGNAVGGLVILVLGAVVAFIADHFIRPVLIGGATRLPFIWVLLGILGGISAWGLVGLFIGPAIMAALILLWREWIGSQKGPINPEPREIEDALN